MEEQRADQHEAQQPQDVRCAAAAARAARAGTRRRRRCRRRRSPSCVTTPRYILRLPIMWATTKPMPMSPVIAITYFLPTAVEYRSRRNGLRLRARACFAPCQLTMGESPSAPTGVTTSVATERQQELGRAIGRRSRTLRGGDEVDEPLDGADQLRTEVGVRSDTVAQPGQKPSGRRRGRGTRPPSTARPWTSGQASRPSTRGRMPAHTSTNGWPVTSTSGPARRRRGAAPSTRRRGGRGARRAGGAGPGRTPRRPPARSSMPCIGSTTMPRRAGRRPTRARAARRRGGPRPRSGWPPRPGPGRRRGDRARRRDGGSRRGPHVAGGRRNVTAGRRAGTRRPSTRSGAGAGGGRAA